MKGTIFQINPRRGMVAIETENGDYSVFENINGEEFDVGDKVYWKNDTGLGSELVENLTKGRTFDVYFENHWVSKSLLRVQLHF